MKNFRTYNLAIEFYKLTSTLELQSHLKEQLLRASSSIALNLAEGSGRSGIKDQARFFHIAFGSLRESQAILALSPNPNSELIAKSDFLAANIYKLIKSKRA